MTYTSFEGHRIIGAGSFAEAARAAVAAGHAGGRDPVLVFDDADGRVVDLDLRGSAREIDARLAADPRNLPPPAPPPEEETAVRTRGRPKLGVVAREVTLLPRHWEWLAQQPGGASVALRKLVDEARRTQGDREARRLRMERTNRFMTALGGDLPQYEEASRAMFAGFDERFEELTASWPADVRAYCLRLYRP
ncbi:MAG TPA: DUF2239 family protein [Telluria sp.]|nr:DUF2239 family protein [Telluria sp.]